MSSALLGASAFILVSAIPQIAGVAPTNRSGIQTRRQRQFHLVRARCEPLHGDADFLGYSERLDQILLIRNLEPHAPIPGDSNRDGVFNSSDLVFVFQNGEYEDGEEANSTFEDGDWNGDSEFDSADFVFAFQAGNYSFAANLASPNDVDSLFATAAALQSDRAWSEEFRKPLPLNVNGTENGLFDPLVTAAKDKR